MSAVPTIDWERHLCEYCRHFDETAYAFPHNRSASGRICRNRQPYEPDLSPFRSHPEFPFVTSRGSCCRAWEFLTFEQQIDIGHASGRLFA